MPDPEPEPVVSRIRVSHVSAISCEGFREIGEPVAFARRLVSLDPVLGLDVSLPFAADLPIETAFWSLIADVRIPLVVPVEESIAPGLRRAGVPLRVGGRLSVQTPPPPSAGAPCYDLPRLEAHLHPFGVAVITTVDVTWQTPVPIGATWAVLDGLAASPATATAGPVATTAAFQESANATARGLVELLAPTDAVVDEPLSTRLVSVIQGERPVVAAMPAAQSPLHMTLHRLSGGAAAIASPSSAFVPQWTGADYAWPTSNLVYMLDSGTALLPTDTGDGPRASEWHRRIVLQTAFLAALTSLVRVSPTSEGGLFDDWTKTASRHLGRLFGPGWVYREWGLVPRAFLERTGATEDVQRVLGAPLTANPKFSVAAYPP